MNQPVTVISPANIAFVKHWGLRDGGPLSPSMSMNLSGCQTTTTVRVSEDGEDRVRLLDMNGDEIGLDREDRRDRAVFEQIERVREAAKSQLKVQVETQNNFPTKAGIASSASGFSALTLALSAFFKLDYDLPDLAEMTARAGSISAVRSLCDYFGSVDTDLKVQNVEHLKDLDLADVIVIVNSVTKAVSSCDAQISSREAPFFDGRIVQAQENWQEMWRGVELRKLGEIVEEETENLHRVLREGGLEYRTRATFEVIEKVRKLRDRGVWCCYSVDAGANVHIICHRAGVLEVQKMFDGEYQVIVNYPCEGARICKK